MMMMIIIKEISLVGPVEVLATRHKMTDPWRLSIPWPMNIWPYFFFPDSLRPAPPCDANIFSNIRS